MSNAFDSPREANAILTPPVSGDSAIDRVRQAVQGIRFGEVRIIIQDGLIVQIERLEKLRFR